MKVYSMVPIEGIPFYTETTCDKTITLVERTPNKIIIEMDSITREAPYGETLTCQEVWVAIGLPYHPDTGPSDLCIFHRGINVNFIKWTMLEKQVTETVEAGIIKAHGEWFKFAEEEGLLRTRRTMRMPVPQLKKSV